MTFMNPAYDSVRGIDGSYQEYIPANDLGTMKSLAAALHDGIKAVRGPDYFTRPPYNLYATAGTSDDYLYSQHFADGQPKILSYTLRWGEDFHPPSEEMRHLTDEVTPRLPPLCLQIPAV